LLFQYSEVLMYLSGVVLIFIGVELYNLRCFEIENSGMVFTIKLFHPLKNGHVFPLSEFPVHALEDFSLSHSFFSSLLRLKIKQRDRIVSVKYKIQGLDHKNFDTLKKSLSSIKNKLKE